MRGSGDWTKGRLPCRLQPDSRGGSLSARSTGSGRTVLPKARRSGAADDRTLGPEPGGGGPSAIPADGGEGAPKGDRKSVVQGKRVSVRVDLGGRRHIKKQKSEAKT